MDVTTDNVSQSIDCDDQQPTISANLGDTSSNGELADERMEDQVEGSFVNENGYHCGNSDDSLKEKRRQLIETTQFFKEFVTKVKKRLAEKRQSDKKLTDTKKSSEPKIVNHDRRIRYQKARKSTNPVQSSAFPFLLCFGSRSHSGKHRLNGDSGPDNAKVPRLDSENYDKSKDSGDELLESNSIKIIGDNSNHDSSDAVLELTFDEPKKSTEGTIDRTENTLSIKKEKISDEMLENSSIKIVTENPMRGSSEAILELTFDEPKKSGSGGGNEKSESNEDQIRIKKEVINDEILENNSIKIVTENEIKGSSEAILELTFDEPRKVSNEEDEKSNSDEVIKIKKETINDDMMVEHNSIKILTTENDTQGSSNAILELTFDEPKKISND